MYEIVLHYLKSYRAGADYFCFIFRSQDYYEREKSIGYTRLYYAMLCYEVL